MAFLKYKKLIDGSEGNYWRINQVLHNKMDDETSARLDLYCSHEQRLSAVGHPLKDSISFYFKADDHPISEFVLGEDAPSSAEEIPFYLIYNHIKSIATYAETVNEANRTQNEHASMFFVDAVDYI